MSDEPARYLDYYAHDPREVDWGPIKEAKALLELPFKVYPRAIEVAQIFGQMMVDPDDHGRILAIGGTPPFICDYALISPRSESAGIQAALSWVLSDDVDTRATSMSDMLSRVFGGGVREIPLEELEGEQRFRDYVTGAA